MKINKELIKEYPWQKRWDKRTELIAKIIPEGISVLDLGGGFGNLYQYLIDCPRYISLDIKEWTDATIKADFNKGEFPDMYPEFQIIVCQGIIEYIERPAEFLESIKKYGSKLLITRDNKVGMAEFKELLQNTGWEVIFSRSIIGSQKLFYCSRT